MNTFFFPLSPLEQFEVMPLVWVGVGELLITIPDFGNPYFSAVLESTLVSFSNLYFVFLLSVGGWVLWCYGGVVRSRAVVPSLGHLALDRTGEFVLSLVVGTVGRIAQSVFPLTLSLLLFILFLNLLGLVPLGFCATSQIIVTQFLGWLAVFGLTLKGIQQLGWSFLHMFIPRNVPVLMLPFLAFIELISFVSRTFSLSIRLFANMVAGHALLHILMGALLSVGQLSLSFLVGGVLFIGPAVLIFAILLLEMGIAFLQAYVFVVLFLIYLNDAYRAH